MFKKHPPYKENDLSKLIINKNLESLEEIPSSDFVYEDIFRINPQLTIDQQTLIEENTSIADFGAINCTIKSNPGQDKIKGTIKISYHVNEYNFTPLFIDTDFEDWIEPNSDIKTEAFNELIYVLNTDSQNYINSDTYSELLNYSLLDSTPSPTNDVREYNAHLYLDTNPYGWTLDINFTYHLKYDITEFVQTTTALGTIVDHEDATIWNALSILNNIDAAVLNILKTNYSIKEKIYNKSYSCFYYSISANADSEQYCGSISGEFEMTRFENLSDITHNTNINSLKTSTIDWTSLNVTSEQIINGFMLENAEYFPNYFDVNSIKANLSVTNINQENFTATININNDIYFEDDTLNITWWNPEYEIDADQINYIINDETVEEIKNECIEFFDTCGIDVSLTHKLFGTLTLQDLLDINIIAGNNPQSTLFYSKIVSSSTLDTNNLNINLIYFYDILLGLCRELESRNSRFEQAYISNFDLSNFTLDNKFHWSSGKIQLINFHDEAYDSSKYNTRIDVVIENPMPEPNLGGASDDSMLEAMYGISALCYNGWLGSSNSYSYLKKSQFDTPTIQFGYVPVKGGTTIIFNLLLLRVNTNDAIILPSGFFFMDNTPTP